MITKDRIRGLIREHDECPNEKLGGLNLYATLTKMYMEHAGIKWFSVLSCRTPKSDEKVWDLLPSYEIERIQSEVDALIKEVLIEDGKV